MFLEKNFEGIICKYPELIEDGLILKGRQLTLHGRRMDMLFEDKFKRRLIIELKVGPIKDEHIGQILSYEGMLLSAEDPTIRVMLVGNRVPQNIQRSLDHHGIAWKEITLLRLKDFLLKKGDKELCDLLEIGGIVKFQEDKDIIKQKNDSSILEPACSINGENPALLALVEQKWIEQAFNYFKDDKDKLYFSTSSILIKIATSLDIKNVYFKTKGKTEISLKADFIGLTEENPVKFRLPGNENLTGKYYYGFKNLRWLNERVNLIDLKRFKSGKNLRMDVPGACIIFDPFVAEGVYKVKATELIKSFHEYVISNPNNRHNKYLTFRNKEKLIEPLGDMLWNEVEYNQEKITEKVIRCWGGIKEPAYRSIQLAWKGLAYCYEYGVVKKMIPRNPFKHMLPKKPRTGSYMI